MLEDRLLERLERGLTLLGDVDVDPVPVEEALQLRQVMVARWAMIWGRLCWKWLICDEIGEASSTPTPDDRGEDHQVGDRYRQPARDATPIAGT